MKNLNKKMIVGLLSLVLAGSAFAATSQTSNFQATSTISTSCSLSVTNLVFGTINQTLGSNSASGSWTATCSNGLNYVMTISPGSSGNAEARTMLGTTVGNNDKLVYIISRDFSGTWLLGDVELGNTHKTNGVGNGTAQTTAFYGKVAGGQYVTPDNYSEDLTMTLTF